MHLYSLIHKKHTGPISMPNSWSEPPMSTGAISTIGSLAVFWVLYSNTVLPHLPFACCEEKDINLGLYGGTCDVLWTTNTVCVCLLNLTHIPPFGSVLKLGELSALHQICTPNMKVVPEGKPNHSEIPLMHR